MTKKAGKVFAKDDLIFAKVKGYPAWPARVQEVNKNRYRVLFFGTYETANLKPEEMWPYNEDTKARYGKPQKKKGFTEAMNEIENNPYLRTRDEIDAGAIPLEGGVSGDTLLEDPSLNESNLEKNLEEEVEEKEEPLLPIEQEKAKKTNIKRKAESSPIATPAKQIKTLMPSIETPPASHSTPSNPTITAAASEEKTSRSGRVLKPKKFEDENGDDKASQNESEAKSTPNSIKKSPRKMWVEVMGTGDLVEIDVDKNKPNFDSKEDEVKWEKQSASDALKFKKKVESGQHIPAEVLTRIRSKSEKTPQEEEILRKEKEMSNRIEKKRFLFVEHRMLEEDMALKMSVHYTNPELERCLKLADQIKEMAITPLMLKKHPDIVTTVRKMRKYVGPKEPEPGHEVTSAMIEKVRDKANELYTHFAGLFDVSVSEFARFFESTVTEFRDATKEMDKDALLELIVDPTITPA